MQVYVFREDFWEKNLLINQYIIWLESFQVEIKMLLDWKWELEYCFSVILEENDLF